MNKESLGSNPKREGNAPPRINCGMYICVMVKYRDPRSIRVGKMAVNVSNELHIEFSAFLG